jgi:hypothetical protein
MLRGLRPIAAARMPELRRWLAANRWALLLPPVVAVGMAAFGAQPWTIAAVVAALAIIVIRWPVIAADFVPFALAALAAVGYLIAARWQSASPAFYQHPMFYGPVWVDGPKSAIAAGAEASAFLALGAWLVPRTIGAHLRTPAPDADLAGGCSGSPRPAATPWTPPPPNCGGSSGTCMTGPRPGWSRSA